MPASVSQNGDNARITDSMAATAARKTAERGEAVRKSVPAMLFHGEACAPNRRACIVIMELGDGERRHELGVLVDAVSQVEEIAPADIEAPPSLGANLDTVFIAGMFKIDGRFSILLDIERVLSVDELVAMTANAVA